MKRRSALLALAALSACSGSPARPAPPLVAWPDAAGPADPGTVVLATRSDDLPYGVAVDGVNVYFTYIDHGIYRAPKRGGDAVLLAADDHGPHALAVDDLWVYAVDLGTPDTDFQDGRVVRVAKGGGPLEVLASGLGAPSGIVLAGAEVVFSAFGTRSFGAYNEDGAIYRAAKDGSAAPARLAKGQLGPTSVAADDAFAYWTNDYGGTVMRCALAGCGEAPSALYASLNEPSSVVAADDRLYWCNAQPPSGEPSGPDVVTAPKAGGGAIVELASSRGRPQSLVLDHGDLIWVETLTHTVQRLPKDGAPRPTAVASDLGLPERVTADAAAVYFSDQGKANVVRVPR